MMEPLPSIQRRAFLKASSAGAAGLATAMQGGWLHAVAQSAKDSERILVVVQLSGGNDGLNTVIPFADESYYKARPKLRIEKRDALRINDSLALHPSMRGFADLLESGKLCVVQGVGYPKPNRSHFESMDIWHSCCTKEARTGEGWLGRWLAGASHAEGSAPGLHLGSEQQPLALASREVFVPSIASIEQFQLQLQGRPDLKRKILALGAKPSSQSSNIAESNSAMQAAPKQVDNDLLSFVESNTSLALQASERIASQVTKLRDSAAFPSTPLGQKLRIIGELISSDYPTRVYYVTLDGFDTHALQLETHAALLRQWSDAVSSLARFLEERGQAERTTILSFSEFGRRVAENASEGTDHGAAAPLFLVGPSLKSSVVGSHPSLTDLDDGDLKFQADFRQVYASILETWFGVSHSEPVLGGRYQPLELWG